VIPTVSLGPGYPVPRIILGAWQLSVGHTEAELDREDSFATWDRALDRGLDTFDCADIYTGVEALIGGYVRRRRRAGATIPRVHTKFVPDLAVLPTIDRDYVARIIDRSLARLGVERLDLVQFHWWDYRIPGYLDVMGWLADLARDGKIRHLGLTNFDTLRTHELVASGVPIATTQVQYSLLDQRPARTLAATAEPAGVRLLCYGALAGGFLSERWLGAPEPPAWENRSLVKYRLIIEDLGGWDRFQAVLTALAAVARRHDTSIAAVALRWVLDRPGVAAAIVGTRHRRHFESIESAFRVCLTDGDRAAIGSATGGDPGPPGDVYDAERVPGGRHAAIMRYHLNARAPD